MTGAEEPGLAWDRLMRCGAWAEAWRISDALLHGRAATRNWTVPRHLQPIWDGTPLDGKRVLVRCYHGLGDTIQFIRFVPMLQAIGAAPVTWAQPALLGLLATMPGIGPLMPLHDGTPDVAYDVDIEVMELAHQFRVTPDTLPRAVPYLHPSRVPPRMPLGARLVVGLVWQAGDWAPHRSIPVTLLRPLTTIPGLTLVVLQRGAAVPTWLGSPEGDDDVLATASTMTGLDLVISVDSMPAHLAGALGVPVWTLLPWAADWRWMEGRADTPWYPTMRLIRQPAPGDWAGVIARVASDLAALAASR